MDVPIPESDPIFGAGGPLVEIWVNAMGRAWKPYTIPELSPIKAWIDNWLRGKFRHPSKFVNTYAYRLQSSALPFLYLPVVCSRISCYLASKSCPCSFVHHFLLQPLLALPEYVVLSFCQVRFHFESSVNLYLTLQQVCFIKPFNV